MLRNFFTVALRNLLRHKGYSLINISGLAIGIACCLLISLYVKDELSFDRYHKNFNRIYRLTHAFTPVRPLQPTDYQVWGSSLAGAYIATEFPEVEHVVQFSGRRSLLFQKGEKRFQENNVFYADSTAFEVFSWNLLEGNPKTALTAPYTVVLTKSTAQRYFGNQEALGQTLLINNGATFQVTGIMEDVPANSHFTFDALLSSTTWRKERPDDFKYWGYVDFYTYFLAKDNFDAGAFMAKVPGLLKTHGEKESGYTFKIEPLRDAYLNSQAQRQPGTTGSLSSLYIFSTIAVFILVIACINFMNLSTARSLDRAKEVGVRKSVGANKSGLVQQFLCESILLSAVATVIAITLASLALPSFQSLSGKAFSIDMLITPENLFFLLSGSIFVGILAGSYPALVLSRFKPALVLKGIFRNSAEGTFLRKSLVVFQFGLSVALIIGSMIVFTQLNHLRKQNLGFTREQILVLDFGGDWNVRTGINSVKTALAKVPSVVAISAQRTVPGGFFPKAQTEIEGPDGKIEAKGPDLFEVDYDFIPTFDIPIVAGRAYSRDFISDSTHAMIVNEAAAREWGYQNPDGIIGKKFSQWGVTGVVIGVVKNFNYRSLHHAVEPLTLRLTPQYAMKSFALRIKSSDIPSTISQLATIWKEVVPQRPFLYQFLDQSFNTQYKTDERFGKLFAVFAGLAIFIACIGLFGLTTYVVEQRTKEIGIRKVLGATVGSLVTLLSRDFLKLVLLAIVVATPLAWYAMNQWLNDFAYRISPGVMIFLAPGLIVVVVALLVVSGQAIRSALIDPVKTLRND